MADWIFIGRDGAEITVFALKDDIVIAQTRAVDEATALAGLPADCDRIVRIGEGAPDTAPCAVLPKTGAALPVITQDNPPDVLNAWMRLWIAGFLAKQENWDGVVWAIDREVSHWIHVSADEIISFSGFLTPQLITALNGADAPDITALNDTLSRPERLAAHLRQAGLGTDPRATTGHLLGAELAAARPYWLGQNVALITHEGDALGYATALKAQGVPVSAHHTGEMLPRGLATLAHALSMTT